MNTNPLNGAARGTTSMDLILRGRQLAKEREARPALPPAESGTDAPAFSLSASADTPIMNAAMGWHDRRDLLAQIGILERERNAAMELLQTLHEWFMKSAPEHYNGCGLWIDVDLTIRYWQNA